MTTASVLRKAADLCDISDLDGGELSETCKNLGLDYYDVVLDVIHTTKVNIVDCRGAEKRKRLLDAANILEGVPVIRELAS